MAGTPYYMSPEVLTESSYGRKADIWSVGATVMHMQTGAPPWKRRGFKQIIQLVMFVGRNKTAVPCIPEEIPAPMRDFLSLCFFRQPEKRPLANELQRHELLSSPSTLPLSTTTATPKNAQEKTPG